MERGMSRLTVAQALVRFLAVQEVERDGRRSRLIRGCFGIFGHGNVAGLGQALHQYRDLLPYHPARNEQAMVHVAAGYARQRNRLGDVRVHDVGRAGRDEHGDRRGARDDQPPPGAAAPRRHVRHPNAAPGAPATRGALGFDRVRERLLSSGVAVLRTRRTSRAADPGGARGDAGADRSGRDRGRHAGHARGRAGRGIRCSGCLHRAARVDRVPPAAGAGRAGARGRAHPLRTTPADRRRRGRDLQRGGRGPAGARRRHRDPGVRDAGGSRRARVRASAQPRRGRRHRHQRRQPSGAGRGSRDRDRHPLERLHDRVEVGVPGPGRALRQRERRGVRRRQAERVAGPRRRAHRARAASRRARRAPRRSGVGVPCGLRGARLGGRDHAIDVARWQ